MYEQDILEGNKLIAEFMGLKLPLNVIDYSVLICQNNGKYHSSWDWLMPVFERIQEIEDNQDDYLKDYFDMHFEINLTSGVDFKIDRKRIFMQTAYGKGQLIEAVWAGVIYFIKWYNENKNG